MKSHICLNILLVLMFTGSLEAADTVESILKRAIQAHGGVTELSKCDAAIVSMKGTINSSGKKISFTAKSVYQFPDKVRNEMFIEDQQEPIIRVRNGNQSVLLSRGKAIPLSKETAEEVNIGLEMQKLYQLTSLLTDPSYEVAKVDLGKEGKEQHLVALRVLKKGMRPIHLIFDTNYGYLTKIHSKLLDRNTKKEYNQILVITKLHNFEGILRASEIEVYREKELVGMMEITGFVPVKQMNPLWFNTNPKSDPPSQNMEQEKK